MTFTYNGVVVEQPKASKGVSPIVAAATSWAWGAIFSRVVAGCGLAACGLFYTLAQSLSETLFGLAAFAIQAAVLECGREILERRRARRMQAVGAADAGRRIHPVVRWMAVFLAIEVVCIIVVAVVLKSISN